MRKEEGIRKEKGVGSRLYEGYGEEGRGRV